MNLSRIIGYAVYNRVWRAPGKMAGEFLRCRCDSIPHEKRLAVVAVLLSVFVLTAFLVFGNACYRIGRGHREGRLPETVHIGRLDIGNNCNGGSPDNGNAMKP